MKEIRKLLGLANDATEKHVIAALDKLESDHVQAVNELAAKLEAQTETSVKGSARINELEAQLESASTLIKTLDDKNRELFKSNKDLALEMEQLKAGGPESQGLQEEKDVDLEKAAKAFLKENKEFKEVFLTEDGQVFIRHSFANVHTKQCGGKIHNFKR